MTPAAAARDTATGIRGQQSALRANLRRRFSGTIVPVYLLYDNNRGWTIMDNDPKRPEPEIMPTHPKEEPERVRPEIPPDKDAPQKESPLRAG
jgi:hypothetical protein